MDPSRVVADLANAACEAPYHVGSRGRSYGLWFEAWIQSWGDTSCGFGGVAGQSFTDSTVATFSYGEGIAVFIAGRLAYVVHPEDPRRDKFLAGSKERHVPGAADWQRSCPHRLPANSNVCDFCQRGQPVAPAAGKRGGK